MPGIRSRPVRATSAHVRVVQGLIVGDQGGIGKFDGFGVAHALPHSRLVCKLSSETLAKALDSGQSRLAARAISWNRASSTPRRDRLQCQRDPVDHEAIALLRQLRGNLSIDRSGRDPGLFAGKGRRHREAGGVRRGKDSSGFFPWRSSSKRLAKP
jgi:hypothetical protein